MSDGVMTYHLGHLADLTSDTMNFSQQLDSIGEEAKQLCASHAEAFQGAGGSSYQEAQRMIDEGIQEGKNVIARHGDAIEQAAMNFQGADALNASNFGSV
jgi:uncharacterized protein YukE